MQPLNTVVTDNVEIIGGEMDPNLFEEDSSKVPQSCQQKRVTLQQIARQQLLRDMEVDLPLEKLKQYQQTDDSLATIRL